eukprot:TRINITY_DN32239_c0_g1_i1.p1 TRINITY_DN32239_c0_g1~~TRINITY_DN32239_c0_g1_i1.p1  ORF type:complete len:331 (+),score=128.71 TRINITY_DN32239_c0_g1_i1:74-994(+)
MRAAIALAGVATASAAVPSVPLRNGVEMPLLALGVRYGAADNATAQAVQLALAAGWNFIDTSHDYGNLKGVGAGLAASGKQRSEYFLDTKVPGCGTPTQGLQPPCFNNTLKMYTENLADLRTDHVDLLLIHFPPLLGCGYKPACKHLQEQWAALEELYAQGKAKAIGVSNFCQKCLECLAETQKVVPHANQMEYHVGMGSDPAGLHSYCQERGIKIQGYSALGHGKVLKADTVLSVASQSNHSAAQVALRWMSQQEKGIITFADNPQYLAEDAAIFGFNLTAAEMEELNSEKKPACSLDAPYSCCH